ncbi:MAG: autotransporter domain-containing protein [Alphaproteobacteria bacterium]|nr:autotransporter domain-containing protein [Alphaproteobacteria bacterium]
MAYAAPAQAADYVVTTGTTDTSAKTVSGTDTLTVQSGGTLAPSASTAVSWNGASTGLVITNSGTIKSTASGGRAINASGGNNTRTLTLTNNAGATIESENDAFRINVDPSGGTVLVENYGTIRSTDGGQALDFDAAGSGNASITINNHAGGQILALSADGIRPDQGAVVTNAGLIRSDGVAGDKNDGIDWQGNAGVVVNQDGGVISGQRHGITSDVHVDVTNDAGGLIEGRNGSGVGSDGDGTVVNYGTITGAWDGVAANGDGDGVDIDYAGTVKNWGTIKGISAAGVDSGGQPNSPEGIAMGGGLIENHAGALISGGGTGILVDDGSAGPGVAATTIVNEGRIEGLGGPAISLVGDFNDSITNSGEIAGVGTAISMGGGDDSLTLLPGSTITGTVDGGDGSDTVTLAGDGAGSFAGAVNFEQLSVTSGTWTLTDDTTFSGGTGITGGTLLVDADLASAVSVGSGGTLGGTGSVTSVAVNDGGTIAPGASIGTLAVTGDFSQAKGSTYAAEIAADGSGDLVAVGGTATIEDGATLAVTRQDGSYVPGTRYTLLTAEGGVDGTYTTLDQTVSGGTELRLGETDGSVFVDVARTAASLPGVAQTPNQAAVASAVRELGVGNAAYAALTLLPDDADVRSAFNLLSGEIHASSRTAMVHDARTVDSAVLARTRRPIDGRGTLWGKVIVGTGTDDGVDGAQDTDRTTIGGIVGAEMSVGGSFRLGIAGAYTRDKAKTDDRTSSARVETGHVVAYASGAAGALRLRAGGGYSWSSVDDRRSVDFAGFSDALAAKYDGDTLHGFAEVGFAVNDVLEPFAGVSAYRVKTDAFAESGGSAALDGEQMRQTYVTSQLGLRFDTPVGTGLRACGSVAWQHGFSDLWSQAVLAFQAGGPSFEINGTSLSRDAAAVSLGLVWEPSPNVHVSLSYDGEIGDNGSSHVGGLTVSVGL